MPKSTVRKKRVYTPPSDLVRVNPALSRRPSPAWVGGLAVGLIVFGLAWLVTFYLSQGRIPVRQLGLLEPGHRLCRSGRLARRAVSLALNARLVRLGQMEHMRVLFLIVISSCEEAPD